MTTARRAEIEALFEGALDRPTAERDAWLAEQTADAAVRHEVGALLAAHHRVDGVLEGDAREMARSLAGAPPPARRVGPYRLLRELGRGGMGVVYLAERDDGQYRRRVALKLLRSSADAEELRRRFLAERQILASLSHRHIAQLLDGGVTDGQLPYIVMEYVEGLPITKWCEQRGLGIDARLRLFRDVCAAVHHAHQNLVIHRDLKPGNILVTNEGEVKLLDFGIAKLLNPTMSAMELPVTRAEVRVMTPEYASPEQVRGETLTTASDVYALGVVLYELLVGQRPYELATASPRELAEVVCEREPERPSARTGVAERARRQLRGDLDAIVMMALRKEAGRRYGSAELLSQDLQRHLDGLPVLAHRGTRRYRLSKFAARHRGASIAAGLALLSLAAGTSIAVRQAAIANRERDRAERGLSHSEEMTSFLVGLFDATAPEQMRGGAVTATDLLRRGNAQVRAMATQPLSQATMMEALARVHQNLGEYPEARALLERSLAIRVERLGERSPEVAGTLYWLAEVMRRQGQYAPAESLSRRALDIRRAVFGDVHAAVAEVLAQLGALAVYRANLVAADSLAQQALEMRRATLGADDPLVAWSLEQVSATLRRRGDIDRAESTLREALALRARALGPDNPERSGTLQRLGDILMDDRDRPAEAESLYREAVNLTRRALGPAHVQTAYALESLGEALGRRGAFGEAIPLYREAVAIARSAYAPGHPSIAERLGGLATVLREAGQLEEAEAVQREAVAGYEGSLGPSHQAYAGSLAGLGHVLLERGRLDEADSLYRRAMAIRDRASGTENTSNHGLGLADLARVAVKRRQFAAADSLYRAGLTFLLRHTTIEHRDVRTVHRELALLYDAWGKKDEAARWRRLAAPGGGKGGA